MGQIQELEALAAAFDQKASLLRQLAAELEVMTSAARTIKPASDKRKRHMSAAAKAIISRKMKAKWAERKAKAKYSVK